MTSSDREILISINGRLERIEQRLDSLEQSVSVIEHKADDIDRRLSITENRVEWMQTTIYWGFAIIAFVAAFVPVIRERRESAHDTDNSRLLREMRYIARDEIEQALKHQQ